MTLFMDTHTRDVRRFNEGFDIGGGGKVVKTSPTVIPQVHMNLQPVRNTNKFKPLPDGIDADDMYVARSQKFEFRMTNPYTGLMADEIDINGEPYICWKAIPWVGYGLTTDHYKAVFIRKTRMRDVPNGP